MLRIALQSKGRLFEDCINLLNEADIKVSSSKRVLHAQSGNFPLEVLYLRDDDIPQSVALGVADIGIVGENEFMERHEDAEIISRLGFSKCRLSLAIPKSVEYTGLEWFNGKKIATSYPVILRNFLEKNNIDAEIHIITGSVEIAPGICLADGIFDIVSSGSTLVSNNLREVEVVTQSEALLIAHKGLSDEKREILNEMLFRFEAVKAASSKKYIPVVAGAVWHSQRDAASAESQFLDYSHVALFFEHLIVAHNAEVGSSGSYRVGNVVVAQKQHFDGEVATLHQQGATALRHLDACLGQQRHGVLIEPSL